MPSPRPNWPEGKEPINGGLWVVGRLLVWLMVLGTVAALLALVALCALVGAR